MCSVSVCVLLMGIWVSLKHLLPAEPSHTLTQPTPSALTKPNPISNHSQGSLNRKSLIVTFHGNIFSMGVVLVDRGKYHA